MGVGLWGWGKGAGLQKGMHHTWELVGEGGGGGRGLVDVPNKCSG